VDAAAGDAAPMPELPISEDSAIVEALLQGPEYRKAVADERAAAAAVKSAYAAYLPWVSLFGSWQAYDAEFFPNATSRTLYGFAVNFPIWNDGQREIATTRARSARAVARAVMRDTELAVRRDVIQASQAYNTARAAETRYRAGATTILDLLTAQVSMSEAEAAAVQARYATLLALAGLEALLGRRLFADRGH
jgi:outer membrane protein TolC